MRLKLENDRIVIKTESEYFAVAMGLPGVLSDTKKKDQLIIEVTEIMSILRHLQDNNQGGLSVLFAAELALLKMESENHSSTDKLISDFEKDYGKGIFNRRKQKEIVEKIKNHQGKIIFNCSRDSAHSTCISILASLSLLKSHILQSQISTNGIKKTGSATQVYKLPLNIPQLTTRKTSVSASSASIVDRLNKSRTYFEEPKGMIKLVYAAAGLKKEKNPNLKTMELAVDRAVDSYRRKDKRTAALHVMIRGLNEEDNTLGKITHADLCNIIEKYEKSKNQKKKNQQAANYNVALDRRIKTSKLIAQLSQVTRAEEKRLMISWRHLWIGRLLHWHQPSRNDDAQILVEKLRDIQHKKRNLKKNSDAAEWRKTIMKYRCFFARENEKVSSEDERSRKFTNHDAFLSKIDEELQKSSTEITPQYEDKINGAIDGLMDAWADLEPSLSKK